MCIFWSYCFYSASVQLHLSIVLHNSFKSRKTQKENTMKTSIKTSIGIIAIGLSSISFAQAIEYRSDRHYDKPRHERNNHKSERREHVKHMSHRQEHFRAKRHIRKHKRYNRHMRNDFRAHKRARNHYRRHHGYRTDWRHKHSYKHYRRSSYVQPRYRTSGHSSHISVSGSGVPVLAGTLIGSAIANNASHGDPVATFGGAVIGAIIGNRIAHH